MSNPNWPLFPGVPNMTVDEQGRPGVLDLVPGKQEGTPLNQAFFDPIIHTLCNLGDALDGYLPLSGGDISGNLTLRGMPVATQYDLTKLLPLTGGTLSGTVLVDGQFAQKGETLSQTLGTQVGAGQFYLQAIQPDNVNHLTGRLVIKDLDGTFYHVLEATTDGTLKNAAGKALAINDDVQAEITRAKGVEQATSDQLTTLQNHAIISDASSDQETPINTMRIVHDTPNPHVMVGGRGTSDYDLKLPNYEDVIKEKQYFSVDAKHGDWITFPHAFSSFRAVGNDTNIAVFLSAVGAWGNDYDGHGGNNFLVPILTTNADGSTNMDASGFRLNLFHYWTEKDGHGEIWGGVTHIKVWAIALP